MIGVAITAAPFFVHPALGFAVPASTKKRGFGGITPSRSSSSSSSRNRNSDSDSDSKNHNNPTHATIRVDPLVVPPPKPETNNRFGEPLPVLTPDIVGLADLRYDEWMASSETETETETETTIANGESMSRSPPSRYAFRMATAEILSERSEGGSVTFVAKLQRQQQQQKQKSKSKETQERIVVGAAELSPIEFEGIVLPHDPSSDAKQVGLYVTDVVTSSLHRRMGIANRLMDALEHYAYEHYAVNKTADANANANANANAANEAVVVTLYLHVKANNPLARSFYSNPQRGYVLWDTDADTNADTDADTDADTNAETNADTGADTDADTDAETVGACCRFDTARLETNAGIDPCEGQVLLCKTLTPSGHRQLTDRIAAREARLSNEKATDEGAEAQAVSASASASASAAKKSQGFGGGFGGASNTSKRNKKGKRKSK